jgi:GNAT superfamily N-acetyltransferase
MLFPESGYVYRRCLAVLDGVQAGRILTDDAATPTWAVVQEISEGTIFLGGSFDAESVAALVTELRREHGVVFGAPAGDPRWAWMPPKPEYDGADIDFSERDLAVDLERMVDVPAGLRLERIDAELLERCAWGSYKVDVFGSHAAALEHGLGYCLLDGDTVVSEAFAGPVSRGTLEMGTITHEDFRRRGLASIVCARTLLECERLGYQTWWSCATQNVGSAAMARKLGYRREEEFRLLAWFAPSTE